MGWLKMQLGFFTCSLARNNGKNAILKHQPHFFPKWMTTNYFFLSIQKELITFILFIYFIYFIHSLGFSLSISLPSSDKCNCICNLALFSRYLCIKSTTWRNNKWMEKKMRESEDINDKNRNYTQFESSHRLWWCMQMNLNTLMRESESLNDRPGERDWGAFEAKKSG